MAKDTASIVSGLGLGSSFFIALIKAVKRLGGSLEDVYNALKEDSPLIEKWAGDVVEAGRKVRGTVSFVLSIAFSLPSWARGVGSEEDREAEFVGKVVELKLVEFLNQSENYVTGEEMLKRSFAKTIPAGNRSLEYLYIHPEVIPVEWQGPVLLFPGTVLLDEGGCRTIQCLIFDDGRWHQIRRWLNDGFGSGYLVVGLCK